MGWLSRVVANLANCELIAVSTSSIIILNGASCTGKTTLAHAIQQIADDPYLIVSLDQYRNAMPDRYRGLNAPEGTTGAEGLNIVPIQQDGENRTSIRFGSYGHKVLQGMRRSILALAQRGLNVIVDDVINESSFSSDYARLLRELDVTLVAVTCDPDEMVRRERARAGRFPGTALTTLAEVHDHMEYDIKVDTTNCSPQALAEDVLQCVRSNSGVKAITRIQK